MKYLLPEIGRADKRVLILALGHGAHYDWSVCHALEPNIFPSGPPTQSISTLYAL